MDDIVVYLATVLIGVFLILTRNIFSPVWLLVVALLLLYKTRTRSRFAYNLFYFNIIVIFIYFLVKYQSVFAPFIIAIILAYILTPLTNLFNRIKIHKAISSLIVVVFVWVALVELFFLVIPPFVTEIQNFISSLSQPLPHIYKFIESVLNQLKALGIEFNPETVNKALAAASQGLISGFGKGLGTTLHILFYLVFTPVATYYFLVDGEKIVHWFYHFIPRTKRRDDCRSRKNRPGLKRIPSR